MTVPFFLFSLDRAKHLGCNDNVLSQQSAFSCQITDDEVPLLEDSADAILERLGQHAAMLLTGTDDSLQQRSDPNQRAGCDVCFLDRQRPQQARD